MENSIGFVVRSISNLLKRRMFENDTTPDAGLPTEMHGMVIDYLYSKRGGDPVFQRDIEARFSIRRSTASGILRLMEKKGILTREPVAEDARLKKLVLTPEAVDIHRKVEARIEEVEALMSRGIAPQDLRTFYEVAEKIKHNLE